MYVRDLLRSLVRRWYLVLVGLVLTAGLSFAVFSSAPISYETQASMLLLPPKSSVGSRGNPYLYLGGLGQAVEVLSARMNSDQVSRPVAVAHPDVEFSVAQDTTTTGPILLIKVTAPSEAEAMQVQGALVDLVPPALQDMQDGLSIPESSRIDLMTLVADSRAEPDTKTRDRALIVVAGVGLAGTLLLTGLIDSLLRSRGPRRPRMVADWGDDQEDDESAADARTGPVTVEGEDVPDDSTPTTEEVGGSGDGSNGPDESGDVRADDPREHEQVSSDAGSESSDQGLRVGH